MLTVVKHAAYGGLAAVALMTGNCAKDWATVQRQHTSDAYVQFLVAQPQSRFLSQAIDSIWALVGTECLLLRNKNDMLGVGYIYQLSGAIYYDEQRSFVNGATMEMGARFLELREEQGKRSVRLLGITQREGQFKCSVLREWVQP
jgi:hypothetical protein